MSLMKGDVSYVTEDASCRFSRSSRERHNQERAYMPRFLSMKSPRRNLLTGESVPETDRRGICVSFPRRLFGSVGGAVS